MAEGVATAARAEIQTPDLGEAVKEALIASAIALVMFIAIVGIKIENAQGGLELLYRFGGAFALAAAVGVIRFLFDLFVWRGLGRAIARRWLPPGTLGAVLAVLIVAAYVLGAVYFIVPGSRIGAAAGVSQLIFDPAWQSRIRIFIELTGFLALTVFIVLSAMGVVFAVRRLWSGVATRSDADTAARTPPAAPATLTEFGQQFAPALLVIAVILPVLVAGDQQRYALDTAIQVLTYIMLGWGLNIVVGLAGLLDLGYVAFYAVGAYSYALIATQVGWSFWVCLPLAGLFAALWGVLLGFPVLRLRGDYLAIVTLAFGEIIRIVLLNWFSLTNGPNGISQIPKLTFFGLSFDRFGNAPKFHDFFGIEYDAIYRIIFLYYVILMLALMVNFVSGRLRRLPIGRAWEALREDEIACRSLGINTVTTKLTAFAIGAMFGGFAGSFFATRQGFISPESFTFHESALILAIVVLGGLGSQIGVVIAAVALIGSAEFFRDLEEFRMLIFGAAMVCIMVWRPRGLISTRAPTVVLKERKAISGALVKEGHG